MIIRGYGIIVWPNLRSQYFFKTGMLFIWSYSVYGTTITCHCFISFDVIAAAVACVVPIILMYFVLVPFLADSGRRFNAYDLCRITDTCTRDAGAIPFKFLQVNTSRKDMSWQREDFREDRVTTELDIGLMNREGSNMEKGFLYLP